MTKHYQHKLKCLVCSLHYIVCVWSKAWPVEGQSIYCPECGSEDRSIKLAVEAREELIFMAHGGKD